MYSFGAGALLVEIRTRSRSNLSARVGEGRHCAYQIFGGAGQHQPISSHSELPSGDRDVVGPYAQKASRAERDFVDLDIVSVLVERHVRSARELPFLQYRAYQLAEIVQGCRGRS